MIKQWNFDKAISYINVYVKAMQFPISNVNTDILTPSIGNNDSDIKNEIKYKLNYSQHKSCKTKHACNHHKIKEQVTIKYLMDLISHLQM